MEGVVCGRALEFMSQLPRLQVVRLRNHQLYSPSTTVTVAMEDIDKALGTVVRKLSDDNYAQSLEFYRFWFGIGQTYHRTPPGQIFDAIWNNSGTSSSMIDPRKGKLVHSTAHLVIRFSSDAESGLLAPHNSGLQNRLCARTLREFFSSNLRVGRGDGTANDFYVETNLSRTGPTSDT